MEDKKLKTSLLLLCMKNAGRNLVDLKTKKIGRKYIVENVYSTVISE